MTKYYGDPYPPLYMYPKCEGCHVHPDDIHGPIYSSDDAYIKQAKAFLKDFPTMDREKVYFDEEHLRDKIMDENYIPKVKLSKKKSSQIHESENPSEELISSDFEIIKKIPLSNKEYPKEIDDFLLSTMKKTI